jgi:predicted nucleotidyltransferase
VRIDSNEAIAGEPIFEIRRLLRRSRGHLITLETVSCCMKVSSQRGGEVLQAIERGGYVAPYEPFPGAWAQTIKGNALAIASLAKPIKRTTAERHLQKFLERVQAVNAPTSRFLYRVERVALFGSLLGDGESVGDVDLAVLLKPAIRDRKRFCAELESRGEEGFLAGQTSSDPVDKFGWPDKEVWIFLKSRCRALSLCRFSDELLQIAPHRIIYTWRGRRKN